jgi:L-seryl-tRNA(Ser) seleniumtransferase
MKEANNSFVFVSELQDAASKVISQVTGAEAGIVTAGAFSAMVAASAACMMRETDLIKTANAHGLTNFPQESAAWLDLVQLLPRFELNAKMPACEFYSQRQPTTQAHLIKDEFIIQRAHHNWFDNAFTVPGGKLVWVGEPTDWSDADEYWHSSQPINIRDLEDKITDRTAAVAFIQSRSERESIQLKETIEVAHKHNIPVIVDACEVLPPRQNLRTAIEAGADLVCFSGGKSIQGPSNTGILAGRSNLVKLANVQGFPYHGVCRGYKVGKEQIVGLIKALQIYVTQDEKTELEAWDKKVQYLINELQSNPNIIEVKRAVGLHSQGLPNIPVAQIRIDEKRLGMTTRRVWEKLKEGQPRIVLRITSALAKPQTLTFNPFCLEEGDEEVVVKAIKRLLS